MTIKKQASDLQTKAMKVATEIKLHVWELHEWEQDWATELRATITTIRQREEKSAQEEFEYQREDNPNYVLPSINMYDCVTEALSTWWDNKKYLIEWSDAQHRLDDYMDAHPKVEQSDDMSRLQAEYEMLRQVQFLGGFGSANEIEKTLSMISSYCHVLQFHSNNGWSGVGSTALDIMRKGIPLILVWCKLLTNLS